MWFILVGLGTFGLGFYAGAETTAKAVVYGLERGEIQIGPNFSMQNGTRAENSRGEYGSKA